MNMMKFIGNRWTSSDFDGTLGPGAALTRSDFHTASFRCATLGWILCRHCGMFFPSVFLCYCFYPNQLIGVWCGGAC